MPDFKNTILNLKKDNNYRNRIITESAQDSLIKVSGKILNNFSSNNYLNLANNKKLKIKLKKLCCIMPKINLYGWPLTNLIHKQ